MSLMDEFKQGMSSQPTTDYSNVNQMVDYVANLAELEKPVGELKLDLSDMLVGGKSLSELQEAAKRARSIPTRFACGGEEFDIHHRRYQNENGCYPRYAAEELREVMKVIFDHPDITDVIRQDFNINHYMDQVVGCMLLGLANVFLAGSGVRIKVTKDTLNPSRLFQIVNDVAIGNVDAPSDPRFTVLPNVEEIDAMTSIALDIFIGKYFGTPGINGMVERQRTILAQHVAMLVVNLITCITEGLTVSALLDVFKEPKWQEDPISLGIYLNEINFHQNLDKHVGTVKTIFGGISNKLISTLVELSLINVDDGGSSFVGGIPKTFLNSNAILYNNMFSKYIIVLASTINGDYPLAQTVNDKAASVMIDYQNQRIYYESQVAGVELTQDYIDKRVESRVLHNTIHDYWKNDTAHTRILRHSLGNLRNRHDGAIEVILSASDDLASKWKFGSSLTLYDEAITNEDEPIIKADNSTAETETKENKMTSHLNQSPNAQNLITLTSGALHTNLGKTIEVIVVDDNRSLLLIGMSSLLALRTDSETTLHEPSTEEKVGYIHDDKFMFYSTPLGIYYETLMDLTPTNSVLLPTNDVLLITKTKSDLEIITTAASGNLPHELPSAIEVAVRRSISESAPVTYNNIWRGQIQDDGYLGNEWFFMVDGTKANLLGFTDSVYPAGYYNGERTPLNWLKMLNTTNEAYSILDDVDLAPNIVMILQRELSNDIFELDTIRYLHVGSMEVAVVPEEMALPYLNNAHTGNLAVNLSDDAVPGKEHYAMFTYLAQNNIPTLFIAPAMKDEPKKKEPVNSAGAGELFGGASTSATQEVSGIDALFGASVADTSKTELPETHSPVTSSIVPMQDSSDEVSILDVWGADSGSQAAAGIAEMTKSGHTSTLPTLDEESAITTEEATIEHQVDMENLLDDMHVEMEGVIDKAVEVVDGELAKTDEVTIDVVDPTTVEMDIRKVSPIEVKLKSFYGNHDSVLFEGKDEVATAREEFANRATLDSERTIALDRYIQVSDDMTPDDALRGFADEHLGGIVCDEVTIDGRLALEVDSNEVDLNTWRELVLKLGATTCMGVDMIPMEGHKWYLTSRYNNVMNAVVIMIVDAYTETRDDIKPVTDLTDDAPQSLGDLLDACEELESYQVPAFANNVILIPERLLELDDATYGQIRNKALQAKELSKEEGKLYIVELAGLIAADRTIPRKIRCVLRDEIVRKIKTATAKFYPIQFEAVTLTTHEDMGAFITTAYEQIKEALGHFYGDEFIGELNTIDVLDNTPITVVVIDESSESIGLIPGMASIPVTSVGIDFDLDTNEEIYLVTGDEKLLKLHTDGKHGRDLLTFVYQ